MTDYFALLGLARRPGLDEQEIKSRFVELCAAVHPDRVKPEDKTRATGQFALLNAAQRCLGETAARLRHLLELENGSAPADIEQVPADSVDLLVKVAQTCRQADAFIEKRRRESSPLLRLNSFEKGMEWTEALQNLQSTLRTREQTFSARLSGWNETWRLAPAPEDPARPAALPLRELEQMYRAISFLARSQRQLQERIAQLTLEL
jgi:curved DNA-binding protein CbpA